MCVFITRKPRQHLFLTYLLPFDTILSTLWPYCRTSVTLSTFQLGWCWENWLVSYFIIWKTWINPQRSWQDVVQMSHNGRQAFPKQNGSWQALIKALDFAEGCKHAVCLFWAPIQPLNFNLWFYLKHWTEPGEGSRNNVHCTQSREKVDSLV